MVAASTSPPLNRPSAADKGLKGSALGLLASIVIGVASTAPAYSLAATLGFIVAFIGGQTPAIVVLAFVPMLFMGGAGSITHMHFDMDLSHILHTQFLGKKRVLLFPYEEGDKLYRKPFEVMSMADFSYYYDASRSKLDLERYSALRQAKGYEVILDHGETLFMPGGYWHHMEYVQSGFAMSLRALQKSWSKKINGAWNLTIMRSFDTLMKKTAPRRWQEWKERQVHARASQYLRPKSVASDDCGGFSPTLGLLWKEER